MSVNLQSLYNNLQSQYKELQESYDEYRGIQHIYT